MTRRKIVFPPVEEATEDGLVAVGGDMEPDTLLEAYSRGIFPWPLSPEFPLAWFSPDPRGVLFFDELHVPRSFAKFLRKVPFEVRFDEAFPEIIRHCATVPRREGSTWITPDIIRGYTRLFEEGHAWCAGAWLHGKLVGGLYGVYLGDFVSGESMFTLADGAGKAALLGAVSRFESEGLTWMDTQMVTSVVEGFGGRYISRKEFLSMLAECIRVED